jgi:hypothetical protein
MSKSKTIVTVEERESLFCIFGELLYTYVEEIEFTVTKEHPCFSMLVI